MYKKIIAAVSAAIIALSLTACGRDDNKNSAPAASLNDKTSTVPTFGEDENAAENAGAGNAAVSAAMSAADGGDSDAAANGDSGVTVGGLAGQYTVAEGEEEPWWCRGDLYIERRGTAYQVAFGDMQRFAGYPSEDAISQQTNVTEFRGDGDGEVIGTVALFRSGIKLRVEFRSYTFEDNKDDDPANDKVSECVFIKIADL